MFVPSPAHGRTQPLVIATVVDNSVVEIQWLETLECVHLYS